MDLFQQSPRDPIVAPLADRMRPRTLDEYIGQKDIVGPGTLLRRAIESDRVSSLILFGPPGTGKTSLAMVIAHATSAHFKVISAVSAGVKEIREVIEQATQLKAMYGKKTLVFCDEVHHFNRSQQDALLPAVENGTIIFIGATTQNPFFDINSALLSRSSLFRLNSLTKEEIRTGIERALHDSTRGFGYESIHIDTDAMEHWLNYANGDLRRALNALELAVLTTPIIDSRKTINLAIAEASIQQRAMKFDKQGDNHYDLVSAFIKSMRGSDPDAALYWFSVLLESGEDPRFIARRLIVHASEDVGLADPSVMLQAQAAAAALEWVGLPEARIPLAQAVLAIALAPKSNSVVVSLDKAMAYVKEHPTLSVPIHLRDSSYAGAQKLGHGKGYLYPHDFPNHVVAQSYLPIDLPKGTFYQPSMMGREQGLKVIPSVNKEKDK